MENKYKVYSVNPGGKYERCYRGTSLVAADNAEEANQIIEDRTREDIHNDYDMWGYGTVGEGNVVENVYSEVKGIVLYGIYYFG